MTTRSSPARSSPLWLAQRERGSALLMRLVLRIALRLGRPAGAALLYPICGYFLLFSGPARRASFDYLRRVHGRPPRWRERFVHYHTFAATILDRVFLHAGRAQDFDCRIEGLDTLRAHLASGRGCLLFGAHFGSFDALRAIALRECPVQVRVLMHDTHAGKMNAAMRGLDPRFPAQVIPLGTPHAMLAVRDALARGELVALLADRGMHGERHVVCPFLGGYAAFPRGPFELAELLRAPIMLFCATYRAPGRYEVRFEPLAGGAPVARDDLLQDRVLAFAAWLEERCRGAPYNWFNFYDFWAATDTAGRP
jgi:predicted LPLAT superfamily acyltransferase